MNQTRTPTPDNQQDKSRSPIQGNQQKKPFDDQEQDSSRNPEKKMEKNRYEDK